MRKDLGEPPLVTPSSQIVGTQAVFNVLMGERYKMVTKETKDILSGKYGATVKPFNEDVQKKCIGDTQPITCRPADLLQSNRSSGVCCNHHNIFILTRQLQQRICKALSARYHIICHCFLFLVFQFFRIPREQPLHIVRL